MTVKDFDGLPGSSAHGRRIGPQASPRIPSVEFITATVQVDKGGQNIAIGRRGAVCVLDGFRAQGVAQDWVASGGGAGAASGDGALEFRSVNQNGGAGAFQIRDRLRFGIWGGGTGIISPFNYDVKRLGYCGDTQRESGTDRDWPVSIGAAMNTANGLSNAVISAEVTADVRYLGAADRSLKPGAWGSHDGTRTNITAGPNLLVAAPGVGKYLRIRSLFIYAIGATNAATQYVWLTYDGGVGLIHIFRTNNVNDRCKIDVRLTDIDIPIPENKQLDFLVPAAMAAAGTNSKVAVTAGVEICDINKGSYINKTGAPA
jgi:hypothetical protein